MLNAFTADPLPRTADSPWLLLAGLLVIGVLWGSIYVRISEPLNLVWWKRGIRFAVIGWTLMVPWFVFYLPWNVLREPILLVALEMVCWAGVIFLVGLTIAGVNRVLMSCQAPGSGREPDSVNLPFIPMPTTNRKYFETLHHCPRELFITNRSVSI